MDEEDTAAKPFVPRDDSCDESFDLARQVLVLSMGCVRNDCKNVRVS